MFQNSKIAYVQYFNIISIMKGKKTFKQTYPKEKRMLISQQAKYKNPQSVIVVIERWEKCRDLPDLYHSRFSVDKGQKVVQVLAAVKQRLANIDSKSNMQTIILMCNGKLLNKQNLIGDIYENSKDKDDNILYFLYTNVVAY